MKHSRTPQQTLELIQQIGITHNIRKQIIHQRIKDGVPTDAVEVVQYGRPFFDSLGKVVGRKYRVMAWIKDGGVRYAD